jgi:membrane-associated phospholipid phosphatase
MRGAGGQVEARAGMAHDGRERLWRRLRWGLLTIYLAALFVWSVRNHVPTGRVQLMSLAIAGVGISVLGRDLREARRLVLDWVPFAAILLLYDSTRGVVDSLGISVHLTDIADAEAWLFGGHIPSVWLQERFYVPGEAQWYDAVFTLVYTSHFIATPALAAVLWVRNRERWKAFVARVVVLSLAGLATYTLFPVAPPWLASREGYIATVLRLSARGWEYLHVGQFHSLVTRAQEKASNPVAAMPSLHTAFTVIVACALAGLIRSRLKWLLALYPLVMGVALVYLGEHYVIDVLAGLVYALAVELAMPALTRWWRARRIRRPAGSRTAAACRSGAR